MKRQCRFDAEFGDAARWSRFVKAILESPCISAFGAFLDGRLGSYAITCLEDGWLEILYKMNSFEFDHLHPCQVLDYNLTRRIATDALVDAVSMGWAPLVARQGLHDYKVRLGYTFKPAGVGYPFACLRPRWRCTTASVCRRFGSRRENFQTPMPGKDLRRSRRSPPGKKRQSSKVVEAQPGV